jgi:DNA modification methylase
MENQDKLKEEEKDEFVEELNLTPEKIKEDLEKIKLVEGFPIGDDEDILELSNPPYYTAYPNPYIKKFIEKYGKPYGAETDDYKCEPFVGDVSEGKNDPIYNAHRYHSKIPHKAIMPFIEHYTGKGAVILDIFSGSGMTGVASCFIKRHPILIDLSSGSTFISYNNISHCDVGEFLNNINKINEEVWTEYGWMYKTKVNGNVKNVNYFGLSEVRICPHCNFEYLIGNLTNQNCPSCNSDISKNFNRKTNKEGILIEPFQIVYFDGKKQFSKKPDYFDLDILKRIEIIDIPYWHPSHEIPKGDKTSEFINKNISKADKIFTKRNLIYLSAINHKIKKLNCSKELKLKLLFLFTSTLQMLSKISCFDKQGGRSGFISGTYYLPPMVKELNPYEYIKRKLKGSRGMISPLKELEMNIKSEGIVSTQSSTQLKSIPENSIDYIFTDPPFGSAVNYVELSFIWESWLNIITENKKEVIINKTQNKRLEDFKELVSNCFKEAFRVLKPNRWITVVFHNSKAEVWKVIQESIVKSGFIIAQVATMDRGAKSFNQLTAPGSVKNDLVINAYKPSEFFRNTFLKKAGLNMEREFVQMHLDKLPIEPNDKRCDKRLYSDLIAQYIQNGFEVRMDASEFYGLLRNNFIERDGFWFNSTQIYEYEKRIKLSKTIKKFDISQTIIWITNEKTAIIWLANFLRIPKEYSEISIEYNKSLMTSDDQIPELKNILEENFVTKDGKYVLPSINEKKEREDIRNKRLTREFNEILKEAKSGKKITEIRKEALLHGLMELYNKRDVDQIKIIGSKLDKKIIESDDDIYAIIDWAMTKEENKS